MDMAGERDEEILISRNPRSSFVFFGNLIIYTAYYIPRVQAARNAN